MSIHTDVPSPRVSISRGRFKSLRAVIQYQDTPRSTTGGLGVLSLWIVSEPDETVPIVKINDIYNEIRSQTGAYWIMGGEKIADSIVGRPKLKRSGCIDEGYGRLYPLIDWRKRDML